MSGDAIIRIAARFERLVSLAQMMAGQDVLTLQNLLKHEPYSYGGKSGTLYGTINLHDQVEKTINIHSGVMARVLEMATIAQVIGAITIQINVNGLGQVRLTGGPPGLIMKLNQIFAPLIQTAIKRLQQGPSVDKDCAGIKLPQSGIKFDWIKFNMSKNSSTPITVTTT